MKTIKIKLFVTSVLTLHGKKKRYILGDMAYGEYLVYEDHYPKYYLNVLDRSDIKEKAKGDSLFDYIESKLRVNDERLTLHHGIKGISLGDLRPEYLELEELPSNMIERWLK